MSPAKSDFDEELARARLAFISAGQPPLGAPRRAAPDPDDIPGRSPSAVTVEPAPARPSEDPARIKIFDRFFLTPRQVVAVLVLLLCGVAVTLTALNRSSASTVPMEVMSTPVTPSAVTPSATATPPPPARVHVLGAVASPGVVTVPGDAIVQDAVLAAGGLLEDADPAELNLAARVNDGQQIIVGTTAEPRGDVHQPSDAAAPGATAGPVNINTASAAELEELPGVGPVLAAAIVAWRQDNGGFTSVTQLQEVTGIGPKSFATLEPLVTT